MIFVAGCARHLVISYDPRPLEYATPAAWSTVAVGNIAAHAEFDETEQFQSLDGDYYRLGTLLTESVGYAMSRRLGGRTQAPYLVDITDLRLVAAKDGLGINAGAVLRSSSKKNDPVRIEHSVTVRGYKTVRFISSELLTRAVEDLCDRILSDPILVRQLDAAPAEAPDSALADQGSNNGPVLPLKSNTAGTASTGRVLWAPGETMFGTMVNTIVGADAKGGMGGLILGVGDKYWDTRGFMVWGAIAAGKETVAVNMNQVSLMGGFRSVVKDEKGYAGYPGFSIFAGPQALSIRYFASALDLSVVEGGGQVLVDFPWGTRTIGSTLGYFAGAAVACALIEDPKTKKKVAGCDGPVLIHSPVFDVWLRYGNNRFGLGLQFLALTASGDIDWQALYRNPSISFTWTVIEGFGLGSRDSGVLLLDMKVAGSSEDLATPVNYFAK